MSIINKPSLTENQLAERWSVSIKTLQDWRRKGTGVSYLKLGVCRSFSAPIFIAIE